MDTSQPNAQVERREVLAALGAIGLGGLALSSLTSIAGAAEQPAGGGGPAGGAPKGEASPFGWDDAKREFVLPPLPYAPDALEPHIDAETMTIHHGQHHAAYVKGLNTALAKLAEIREGKGDAALTKHWTREFAFHAGGHFNHCLLWMTLAGPKAGGGGQPTGNLAKAIDRDFGSFAKFSDQFMAATLSVEGSGWGWLVYSPTSRTLVVTQGEKQQNMFGSCLTPIMGCDVWEHAYYLKYRSKRKDYIEAFMNVVNWPKVGEIYEGVSK